MKTVLVTGSAGFIGRHLVPVLHEAGYDVRGIPFDAERHLAECYQRFDVVVHLAANIAPIDERMKPSMQRMADILLDYAICQYLQSCPPYQKAILLSSCATDNPDDPYAFCKIALERFARELFPCQIPVAVLRPFSGYAEDQAATYPFRAILERAARRENPLLVWGSLDTVRDWIHVDDLVRAILWAIDLPSSAIPLDIGTGVGTTMHGLAARLAAAVGYWPEIVADEAKPTSSRQRIADTRTANQMGFEAKITLEEGVARAVKARMGVSKGEETAKLSQA